MITRDSHERTRDHRGASNGDHQQRQQLGRHHTHKSSREIVDSVFADHAQGQELACTNVAMATLEATPWTRQVKV